MLIISSAKTLVLRYFFTFFFLLEGIALWDSIDNSIKDPPSTLFHRLFASHSPPLNNYRLITIVESRQSLQSRRPDIVNIWNTQFFSFFFYIKILLYTFRRCRIRLRTRVIYNTSTYAAKKIMLYSYNLDLAPDTII